VSLLRHEGVIDAVAVKQLGCFEAAVQFARTEGVIPAPETSHAIRTVIDEAIKAREEGKEKTILFNFSGHGHFDLSSYDMFFSGKLDDYEYPGELVNKALLDLPKVDLKA
jgi:tryptophan synthase beta chain